MRRGSALWGMTLLICIFATAAMAGPAAPTQSDSSQPIATTHGSVALRDGRHFGYTARAGYLTLVNDETREETARRTEPIKCDRVQFRSAREATSGARVF